MRLWHYELIPYLPNSQLIAQWRELNLIFKKQLRHILINYVYDYSKDELFKYSEIVINELNKRKYNIKSYKNMTNYFDTNLDTIKYTWFSGNCFCEHHNQEYLEICYYNLKEKYLRGQKDFDISKFNELTNYFNKVTILRS